MGGIGRCLLHRLGDDFQARFPGQRRHRRRPCPVATKPGHAFVKIALLPAPDGGPGRLGASCDVVGATAICRRPNDLGPPNDLARRIPVAQQGLKLLTVSGAKLWANVIASHAVGIAHREDKQNHPSGGEL